MSKLQAPVYNMKGEKVGTQDLSAEMFGVEFKDSVVHQVIVSLEAAGRSVIAHTKGRSDVRGGGKKPWKQKGTGRARAGSIRSPLWKGGGITFGPTSARNFTKRVNKKVRKQALKMVLSDKVKNERLIIVDEWGMSESKTKQLAISLKKLPSKAKKTLLLTTPKDSIVMRAAQNLPKVVSLGVGSLNVLDLLKSEFIIVPKASIETIQKKYA